MRLGPALNGSTLGSVLDGLGGSTLDARLDARLDGSTLGSVLDGHGGLALGSRLEFVAWLDARLDTQRSWQLDALLSTHSRRRTHGELPVARRVRMAIAMLPSPQVASPPLPPLPVMQSLPSPILHLRPRLPRRQLCRRPRGLRLMFCQLSAPRSTCAPSPWAARRPWPLYVKLRSYTRRELGHCHCR